MGTPDPQVDEVFAQATSWKPEMERLREILLDIDEFTEARKWWQACYVFEGANVAIISAFKDAATLNFFKGSLLADPEGVLVQPGPNSQSSRFWRFTTLEEIDRLEPAIRAYLANAIDVERQGLEVEMKKTEDYPVPEELLQKFEEDPDYQVAFEALTPGRQRGYLLHFAQAKQSKTRASRIEKARERIEAGRGFNER